MLTDANEAKKTYSNSCSICITIDCNVKIAETVKRCVKRRIRYYSYTGDTSNRLNYHDDYL